jgi:predicted RNA-binding protein with RPS1 domain
VVSENILESEGKNILVVRTGQKDSDSLMVTVRAEFDEDFLIDSEEKIELLVKKAREMKEEASEMKKELLEFKIEAIEFQDKEGALFKDNEEGESLEESC